jgi:hypothetical protein
MGNLLSERVTVTIRLNDQYHTITASTLGEVRKQLGRNSLFFYFPVSTRDPDFKLDSGGRYLADGKIM